MTIVEAGLSSQLAAQVDVGDDALIAEMRSDIAVRAGKVGQCLPPGRWVGSQAGIGDVGWNRIAGKEPDPDSSISQLRCIYLHIYAVSHVALGY